jgi:hypothetical protein
MLSTRFRFAFALAVSGLFWLPVGTLAQDPQAQEQKTASAPPEPGGALADIPLGKLIVIYQNGELTIKARNAPLIDVLRAVCSQVGAVLDSEGASDEPIVAILGPGPAKEVLAALLSYSHFNYVLSGSDVDTSTVARVIVFPKTEDSKASGLVAQGRVSQKQDSSANGGTSSIGKNSGLSQLTELLSAAKAEVANSGGIFLDTGAENGNDGDADAAVGAQGIDASTILGLVEAQMNAIGDAAAASDASNAKSAQPGQQAGGAAAPQSPFSIPRRGRR